MMSLVQNLNPSTYTSLVLLTRLRAAPSDINTLTFPLPFAAHEYEQQVLIKNVLRWGVPIPVSGDL
jgi:hypothetical protein